MMPFKVQEMLMDGLPAYYHDGKTRKPNLILLVPPLQTRLQPKRVSPSDVSRMLIDAKAKGMG